MNNGLLKLLEELTVKLDAIASRVNDACDAITRRVDK